MRRKCLRSVVLAFTEELVRPRSVLGKPTIVNYISELQKELWFVLFNGVSEIIPGDNLQGDHQQSAGGKKLEINGK